MGVNKDNDNLLFDIVIVGELGHRGFSSGVGICPGGVVGLPL